jgi:Ecdysteroid kinase-like family
MATLTQLSGATPEWLAEALRSGGGCLGSGRVTAVAAERVDASSWVAHLTLSYSVETPDAAPRHVLLKVCDPELEGRMPQRNKREIAFYRTVAGTEHALPLVHCYDASYQTAEIDRFHLLLADPSATTHRAYRHQQMPPNKLQREQIIDTLAVLHAKTWETHLFDRPFEANHARELHTGEWHDGLPEWIEQTLPRFLRELGDLIPSGRADLYERIGGRLPALLRDRELGGSHLALTQGDVHRGNFLYPREATSCSPLIVDWKRAAVTVPARDLSYMMALHWFPSTRERFELPLLRRYHAGLVEYGVEGYSWDDLWFDYRLSVLKQLLEPIWGWSVAQNNAIWWHHLERITLAIGDLECEELIA